MKKKTKKYGIIVGIILIAILLCGLLLPESASSILANFIAQDLRIATPLAIAAIGLVFNERAGIVNIGAEGFLLTGALSAWMGTAITGSTLIGSVTGMLAAGVMALLFSVLTITLRSNQIVIGVAINILGLGITSTIFRAVQSNVGQSVGYPVMNFDFLAGIPKIGPFLDTILSQHIMVYIMAILVFVLQFILFRTNLGLKIRSVGEHPKACDTVGINVNRIRYGTTIFGGLMSGLAGAILLLDVKIFAENMVGGKGFIALAAVIFGKYTTVGAFGASLIFGGAESIQYLVKSLGWNWLNDLISMLPYVITIIALCGLVGKTHQPAASGTAYVKE
ncbi:ABC transporter permease [endosymbiont 'TC1' of Trimyema compressum]|uniref:ABC transporter permease n=1 Tax=endosymbiont 'TC1' of Trimyema compressum TaxID=243899 RepID=UPI000B1D5BFE|nr:ABC transporter permease [endosymbiont 'TC1' of Trimyema compressum]